MELRGPGVRSTKQVEQTLRVTLSSELNYSEFQNSVYLVAAQLI